MTVNSEIPLTIFDYFNTNSIEMVATDPFMYKGTPTFLGTGQHHCETQHKAFEHGVKVSSLCMDSLLVNGYGQYRKYVKVIFLQ